MKGVGWLIVMFLGLDLGRETLCSRQRLTR
jgi:hypothetical protein